MSSGFQLEYRDVLPNDYFSMSDGGAPWHATRPDPNSYWKRLPAPNTFVDSGKYLPPDMAERVEAHQRQVVDLPIKKGGRNDQRLEFYGNVRINMTTILSGLLYILILFILIRAIALVIDAIIKEKNNNNENFLLGLGALAVTGFLLKG